MKELLVISGKGGTGKTSIVGSFAALAQSKVLVDCDVDAADLHLLLKPDVRQTTEFYGGEKAVIDGEACIECGKCMEACRYGAIRDYTVNPVFCEGCGVCYHICPQQAVSMVKNLSGHWFISDTSYGPLVHARLGIAEENSGKLVSEVRRSAREVAKQCAYDYIITDGPPGIGCPVISSLSGVDLALVVTEPTVAGIHDLRRVLQLTSHFGARSMVCINKFDLDEKKTGQIQKYCSDEGVELAGLIPFDEAVNRAIVEGVPLVEYSDGDAARAVKRVWKKVEGALIG